MPGDLRQVDSKWAWTTYQPDGDNPWNRRTAAHLFRRAGYGANSATLDEAVAVGPHECVQRLLNADETTTSFQQDMNQLASTTLAGGDPKKLSAWWLYRALHAPDPLHDKMTLFWHGHFATSAARVTDVRLMYGQHSALRSLGLGKFADLARALSRNPAMLIYLDSATNRKRHPNENYARELMELFCLGIGNYTEQDIRELARCFTGWEIRRGRFTVNKYQHDNGTKSFLGHRGAFGGDDAVRIVVDHPATASFLTGKLIRFLVCDDTEIPAVLIKPLADDFRGQDLNVRYLVERILTSQLFYSDFAKGRKIRSPVELAIGLLKTLDGTTNTIQLAADLDALGQALFFPPSVKGWDGGRAWINSSTLLARANLVGRLVGDDGAQFGGGSLEEFANRHGAENAVDAVEWLSELLIAVPLRNDTRKQLAAAKDLSKVVHLMGALPEFQLC